jgi:hypothetical protein
VERCRGAALVSNLSWLFTALPPLLADEMVWEDSASMFMACASDAEGLLLAGLG